MKFGIDGEGWAPAFDEAAAGTHEVRCGFSLVVVFCSFPFLFYSTYDFVHFVSRRNLGML